MKEIERPDRILFAWQLTPEWKFDPDTAKATEVFTKYIVTDMYAKAVQGMSAEDSVKQAEAELKKIYEG